MINFGSYTLKDAANGFRRASEAYTKLIKNRLDKAGNTVLREAKILVPRDTGYLSASTKQTELTSEKVVISSIAPYSAYVHEGTYKMKARPYLKNAATNKDAEINQILSITLDDLIKEIIK